MKRAVLAGFLFCSLLSFAAPLGVYQHGTVIRMHMGNCSPTRHGFVASLGGPQMQVDETCPEYTLVSEKVVFIIVGKNSSQLVPLAEIIDFRVHKNELAVRVDDARHESKFAIKEMVLRAQWDLIQKHIEQQMAGDTGQPMDRSVLLKTR
ncbi:MAG TPA: hypothetical protein VLT90_16965 [Terriglobales bacterium]|nr:hypothetical protein [Terriglobales bacterium]